MASLVKHHRGMDCGKVLVVLANGGKIVTLLTKGQVEKCFGLFW